MGKPLDRHRDSARVALEPWLVEAALERLGNTRFTPDEQRTIVGATRTLWKVGSDALTYAAPACLID
jgi:hypothetical protein